MELKDTAHQALISIISTVTEAVDFLKGEVPKVVEELLRYYTALYALGVFVGAAMLFATYAWYRAKWPAWKIKYDAKVRLHGYCLEDPAHIIIPCVMVAVAAFGILVPSGIFLLKITVAPRIWLVEYASNLVK